MKIQIALVGVVRGVESDLGTSKNQKANLMNFWKSFLRVNLLFVNIVNIKKLK